MQPSGQGARPDHDLRGHRRRRQGRQVHRLRREPEHPDQPRLRQRRRRSSTRPPTRSSSRTPTATARPTTARSSSPAGAPATPTPARATCGTGSTTGSTGSSATPASTARSAASGIDFRQGFYRFKPDGSKLEFLRSTNNNSWGVGFSEEGLLFGSTANGCPSVYMPIPNRYYESVRGWSPARPGEHRRLEPVLPDHRQGPPGRLARRVHRRRRPRRSTRPGPTRSTTGTGRRSSPSRPGTSSPRSRCSPDGTRLRARTTRWNLVASDDEWTSPIMAEVGPDGNVWVIDWYNFIVQHNPTPAGLQDRQGRRLRDARSATRPTAGSTGSSHKDGSRREPDRARPGRPEGARRGAQERQPCSGGCTPSGCSSSAARRTSCPT